MIEIRIQQRKMEILRDTVDGPGDRIGLVAAHHEAADLLLIVGQPVRIAQRRQVGGHAEGFRDDILMLHRDQRHVDPEARRKGARPLAGADNDALALDPPAIGADSTDAPAIDLDVENFGILEDGCSGHPRATRQRLGDVGGIGLAVGRQIGGTNEVVDLHQRPERLRFRRRQQLHVEAEGLGGGGLPLDLGPAFLVAGEPQAAIHLPAGGEPRLRLEPLVEIDGIAEQLGDVGVRAQLADKACRMKGRARRELPALQQHRVGPAELGQMIGRGAADDAAADDDRLRCPGQFFHRRPSV